MAEEAVNPAVDLPVGGPLTGLWGGTLCARFTFTLQNLLWGCLVQLGSEDLSTSCAPDHDALVLPTSSPCATYHPQIGIIGSLAVSPSIYIAMATVLTGECG